MGWPRAGPAQQNEENPSAPACFVKTASSEFIVLVRQTYTHRSTGGRAHSTRQVRWPAGGHRLPSPLCSAVPCARQTPSPHGTRPRGCPGPGRRRLGWLPFWAQTRGSRHRPRPGRSGRAGVTSVRCRGGPVPWSQCRPERPPVCFPPGVPMCNLDSRSCCPRVRSLTSAVTIPVLCFCDPR